jgi:hypothetical protein
VIKRKEKEKLSRQGRAEQDKHREKMAKEGKTCTIWESEPLSKVLSSKP